jgi:hypothetical protein
MATDDIEKRPSQLRSSRPQDHPGLAEQDVIAHGGWHPRYTRVLTVASDGDYGFVLIDGNGNGAELEAETWIWHGGNWVSAGSFGVGPLDQLGPSQTGGQIGNAYFAYGSAPGRQSISIDFDGRHHQVPVNRHGVWSFIKVHTGTKAPNSLPQPLDDQDMGTPSQ